MQVFYFSYLKLYKCRVYYRHRKKKELFEKTDGEKPKEEQKS